MSRTPIHHDNGRVDARYTIDLEHGGWPTAQYVARFEGRMIGHAEKRLDAVNVALLHQRKRNTFEG